MTNTTEQDINPIENGIQQAYIEIREALEMNLMSNLNPDGSPAQVVNTILLSLDDAVSNNWDELMATFWRGVKQDIELMEEA